MTFTHCVLCDITRKKKHKCRDSLLNDVVIQSISLTTFLPQGIAVKHHGILITAERFSLLF